MRTRAVANRPKQHENIEINRQRAAETTSIIAPKETAKRADLYLSRCLTLGYASSAGQIQVSDDAESGSDHQLQG